MDIAINLYPDHGGDYLYILDRRDYDLHILDPQDPANDVTISGILRILRTHRSDLYEQCIADDWAAIKRLSDQWAARAEPTTTIDDGPTIYEWVALLSAIYDDHQHSHSDQRGATLRTLVTTAVEFVVWCTRIDGWQP